jgi:hypothetical protein
MIDLPLGRIRRVQTNRAQIVERDLRVVLTGEFRTLRNKQDLPVGVSKTFCVTCATISPGKSERNPVTSAANDRTGGNHMGLANLPDDQDFAFARSVAAFINCNVLAPDESDAPAGVGGVAPAEGVGAADGTDGAAFIVAKRWLVRAASCS